MIKFSYQKILIAFGFFYMPLAFSYDAIVIVLQAPLLKEANLKSKVLQTIRHGERVFVPNEIGNQNPLPEFIQTFDRVGNVVYIPSRYIKIITHEVSEYEMPIKISPNDPTDYRLEEPIPSTYPFANESFLRANLAFTMGTNGQSPYDYQSTFSKQSYSNELGLRLCLTKKADFDQYDRFYFGFLTSISSVNNQVDFQNGNTSKESRSLIKFGPIITFDTFKNNQYRLSLGSGFTYNYHKSSLEMSDQTGQSEDRWFTGFSFSPFINGQLQVVEVLPSTDLVLGADINFLLPHKETTKDQATIEGLWNNDSPNQIVNHLNLQAAFFLGIQVRY